MMMVSMGTLATAAIAGLLYHHSAHNPSMTLPLVLTAGLTLATPHYVPYAPFNMTFGGKYAMTLEGLSEVRRAPCLAPPGALPPSSPSHVSAFPPAVL